MGLGFWVGYAWGWACEVRVHRLRAWIDRSVAPRELDPLLRIARRIVLWRTMPQDRRTSRGHGDGLVKSSTRCQVIDGGRRRRRCSAQSTLRMARSKLVTCSSASEAAVSPSPAAMASSSSRVLADMLGQVGKLVDDQAPDPGGEVVVANEDVLEMGVAGGSVDELVDRHVLADEGGPIAVDHLEVLGSGRRSPASRRAWSGVAFSAARRAACGSRSWRISEMAPSSVTSTTVANVPRRG